MASSPLEHASKDLKVARYVIAKLGETFDSFQTHSSSIISLAEQWRNLEVSFGNIHDSLDGRVKEIESIARNLQSYEKEVGLRSKKLEFGEVSMSERIKEVELRQMEVKKWFDIIEAQKRVISERSKAVEATERELSEGLRRVKAVDEEVDRVRTVELAVNERCEAVELEETRVKKAEMEVNGRCRAVELEEARVREVEMEVNERCKVFELEEARVREVELEVNERCKAVELEETRVKMFETEVNERSKAVELEVNEHCRAIELDEIRVRKVNEELESRERAYEEQSRLLQLREKEIDECCRKVEVKERVINEREEVVDVREKELNERAKELKLQEREQSRVMEVKERVIGERQEVVKVKEEELDERAKEMKLQECDSRERIRVLEAKERAIDEREEVRYVRKRDMDERAKEMELKESCLRERIQVVELREGQLKKDFNEIELKRKEMNDLYGALDLKEKHIIERCIMVESKESAFDSGEKEMMVLCEALELKEKEISDRYTILDAKEEELKDGCKALEEKEKQMKTHCEGVELKEKEVDECSHAVDLKQKRVDECSKELEVKERQLNAQLEVLKLKDNKINERSKSMDLKGKEAKEILGRLKLKEEQMNKGLQVLDLKEKRIVKRCQAMEGKEKELDDRSKELEVKENEVNERYQVLKQKEQKIAELKKALESKEGQYVRHCSDEDGRKHLLNDEKINRPLEEKLAIQHSGTSELGEDLSKVCCNQLESKEKQNFVELKQIQNGNVMQELKENQIYESCKTVELKEENINDSALEYKVEQKQPDNNLVVSNNWTKNVPGFYRLMQEDGKTLQMFVNEEFDKKWIRKQITFVLKKSSNPAKLVLDAVEGFFPPHLSKDGVTFEVSIVRRTCLLLLEVLLNMKPVVSEALRAEAQKVALKWRVLMRVDGESEVVIVAFLLLLVLYDLGLSFKMDDLRRLCGVAHQHRLTPRLRHSLGLPKIFNVRSSSPLLMKEPPESEDSFSVKVFGVTGDILTLCRNMNAHSLRLYLVKHVKKHNLLQDKILDALKYAPDPAKLVLDVCQSSAAQSVKNHGDDNISSSIFLLEQLIKLSPSITPEVKDEAVNFASFLNPKLKGSYSCPDHFRFLQFVAAYNLASAYSAEELASRFKVFYSPAEVYMPEQNTQLCFALGLANKIPGVIKSLIKRKKFLMAVKFICSFKLEHIFKPVPLLEAHLKIVMEKVQAKQKGGSFKAKVNAEIHESLVLQDVLKCISNFKLESQLPPDRLLSRMKELEKEKKSRRAAAKLSCKRSASFSHSISAPMQQEKRPRLGTVQQLQPESPLFRHPCPPRPPPRPHSLAPCTLIAPPSNGTNPYFNAPGGSYGVDPPFVHGHFIPSEQYPAGSPVPIWRGD